MSKEMESSNPKKKMKLMPKISQIKKLYKEASKGSRVPKQ